MYVIGLEKIGEGVFGEKIAKLSGMLKERLPIPEGFVINREGFEFFLKKNKLEERIERKLENLDVDDYGKLMEVSSEIKEMFLASQIPERLKKDITEGYDSFLVRKEAKSVGGAALDFIRAGRENIYVSVRVSPATSHGSSFPGLFDTFLNISGQKGLFEAIKLSFASLYSPRAIFYRKKKGFESECLGGLVVQRMVDSEKSGVILNYKDSVVIEGSWGFGNSLSYGLVSPDRYLLDGYSGEIRESRVGRKVWMYKKDDLTGKTVKEVVVREKMEEQILGEREMEKIFELHKRVSDHYSGGQIVEWAIERGRIYLLQVRSLPETKESGPNEEGGEYLKGYGISEGFGKGPIRMINNTGDFERIGGGDVIATKILSPELIPFLGKAGGMVSEYGSLGSSISLVCREMGIPCVTEIDISQFSDNQMVSVDGAKGGVYYLKSDAPDLDQDLRIGRLEGVNATEVKLNFDLSMPFDFERVSDGIGLLTSEGLFANQNPVYIAKTNPEELLNVLMGMESIARNVYPKTVWYRSYSSLGDEINPILGMRGVRKSLEDPDMLKCEIETLKRLYSKGLNNVGILLSFISSVSEFRAAKQFIPFSLKLGIEVSIPSTALEIESFCKEGLNLVSINLPELTQLTTGVDRSNANISHLYSELNPAVMRLIESVVRACKHYNVEVSVSLERYDPDVIEKLVRIGVNSVSLSPEYVEEAKSLVSRTEKRMLLEKFRDKGDFEIVS
jgi:pyruvate,water dikinase